MTDQKKAPEQVSDDALDAAQGGWSGVVKNWTTAATADGTVSYDNAGPGIVHRTATKIDATDVEEIDGMHIDPVIPR